MSDYASSSVALFYGTDSTDAGREAKRTYVAYPDSPAKQHVHVISAATGASGTSVVVTDFTVLLEAVVYNKDATNYVTITYTALSSNATQVHRVPAGQWVKLTDIKKSSFVGFHIQAHTSPCVCEVWLVGT